MPKTPAPVPPRTGTGRLVAAALAGAIAAASLVALGRFTADDDVRPGAPASSSRPAARVPSRAARTMLPAQPAALAPRAVVADEAPPARNAAEAPATRAELVGRVTSDARVEIERIRHELVARCWPEAGLESGRERAEVVFNVTFDAQGREIARGISEDRRAPAGSFARCLRGLRAGTLSIPPPGARVGVKVPIAFP